MVILTASSLAQIITPSSPFQPFHLPLSASLQGQLHSVRLSPHSTGDSLAFQIILSPSTDDRGSVTPPPNRIRVDVKIIPSTSTRGEQYAKTLKHAETRLKSCMGKVIRVSAGGTDGEEPQNEQDAIKVVRVQEKNMMDVEVVMRKGGNAIVLEDGAGVMETIKEVIDFSLGPCAPSWVSQDSSQSTVSSPHASPIASFDTTRSMVVDPELLAPPLHATSMNNPESSRKRRRSNEDPEITVGSTSIKSMVSGWLASDQVPQAPVVVAPLQKKKKNLSDLTRTVLGGLAKEDAVGAVGIEVGRNGNVGCDERGTTYDPLDFDPIISNSPSVSQPPPTPVRPISDVVVELHPLRQTIVAPTRRIGITTSNVSDENSGSGTQSSTASKGKGVAKAGSTPMEEMPQSFRHWESEDEDDGYARKDRMDVAGGELEADEIVGAGMYDLDEDMEDEEEQGRVESPRLSPGLVQEVVTPTDADLVTPAPPTLRVPNAQRRTSTPDLIQAQLPTQQAAAPPPQTPATIVNPNPNTTTSIRSISATRSDLRTDPPSVTTSTSDAVSSRLAKQTKKEQKFARKASKKAEENNKREEQRLQLQQRTIAAYVADPTLSIEYTEGLRQKTLEYRTLASIGAGNRNFSSMDKQSKPLGERVDLIVAVRNVERIVHRTGDYLVNFNVQDPTLWEDDDYLKISLFSVDELKLPEDIQPGSCLLIRNGFTNPDNNFGRLTVKGAAKQIWQFALLVKSSDGQYTMHQGQRTREPKYPAFSSLEMLQMQRVCDWYATTVKGAPNQLSLQNSRPQMTLAELVPGHFCDINAVEIVGIAGQEPRLEVYVTDYSFHPDFFLERENYRRPGLRMPGMVTEITLWEGCATGARGVLASGTFISMRNLLAKMGVNGIQGALRQSHSAQGRRDAQDGTTWKILSPESDAVKELLRRKEASIRSMVSGDVPEALIAEVVKPDVYADLVGTRHTTAHVSSISDILSNQTIPNRFRIKAKVASMFPGKSHDFIIAWCKTCDRRFRCFNCEHCNDRKNRNAEYRYRFVVMLRGQSEPDSQLPVQMWHPHIAEMLEPLPPYPTSPGDLADTQKSLANAGRTVGDLLMGTKHDGERPFHIIDWSIESFCARSPDDGQEHRMFRAFDMTELGR